MKKADELEQRMMELNFRISKMDERIKDIEEENEELRRKLSDMSAREQKQSEPKRFYGMDIELVDSKMKKLSDELYNFVEKQNRELAGFIDENRSYHERKLKLLSDELYQYIGDRENILRKYMNENCR